MATPTDSSRAAGTARPAPGPAALASLRELVALRDDPLGWVTSRRERWGDVFALRPPLGVGGTGCFVFACSPEAVRDVLTDATTFTKHSPVYEEMARVLGDGLLTSEGERWRAQRRTLQPLFTRRRVDAYGDAFATAAEGVTGTWEDGQVIDLDVQTQRISLASVSVTLFGTDVTDDVLPIVHATGELSEATVARGLAPVSLPAWLPTPRNRRLQAAQRDLEARVDAVIQDRRDAADGSTASDGADDLVTLLLTATDPETGTGLTDLEIREQALVFLLAGHDTTSTAMTFALQLLGRHPDIQEAARAEARAVLGDGPASTAHAGRLDLVRRVLDEAMRLYPPAYITSRKAMRDTTVAGFEVPAGGVVATSFYALQRNPAHWDRPDAFDPDRFLPDAVKQRDPYAYLPFGGGPRSCIGNHFALLEATLALATVLRDWRLESRTTDPSLSLGITLRPKEPVLASVTRA